MRAAEVEALHALLRSDLTDAEVFRERLREIIAPEMPPFSTPESVPGLD